MYIDNNYSTNYNWNKYMSKNINQSINIPFSYSKLYSTAKSIANSMLKDIDAFADYGVTAADAQYLIDSAERLTIISTDAIMRNLVSVEVEEKTSKREVVSAIMRSIALRSNAVFGAKSANAKALNAGNISMLRDSELETAARRIHATATAELEALAEEGITQAYLDKFDAAINAFKSATDRVQSAASERLIAAEKRQALAAEIFTLTKKYSSYGKAIFEKVSPARYKHYVMHKSKKDGGADTDEAIPDEIIDEIAEN